MSRILLVEDEPGIASFIAKGLEAAGHDVEAVPDGLQAVTSATHESFDLMILDLGLPHVSGHDVLEEVRARGVDLPVIILSARSGVEEKVAGLEGGASDYVTKPFRMEELLARITARLREHTQSAPVSTLKAGDLRLDVQSRTLHVGSCSFELSSREFGLARMLLGNAGVALTREDIMSQVWGYEHDPGSNVVDVYVGYLRRKLGHHNIETVRGVGYRLVDEPQV